MTNILAPIAALSIPDAAAVSSEAQTAIAFIDAFVIDEQSKFEYAAEQLKAIKSKANALEDRRTAITGPINTALRAINDLFRGPSELLKSAETKLKGKMLAWTAEQQRIAAEKTRLEREAAETARKEAERQAEELAAKAVVESRKSEEAMSEGDDVLAGLAAARAQRAAEDARAAVAVAQAPAAVIPYQAPKTQGISTSKKLDVEVSDLHALVVHIAEHPELIGLVAADMVRIRAHAKSLGIKCATPGLRVFETAVLSART